MTHTPGAVALMNAIRRARDRRRARRASGAGFRAAREKLRIQLWRGALWPFAPCPTPGVEAYRKHEGAHVAAVAVMRHSKRSTFAMPFKCRCGYWHIEVGRGDAEWEDES